MTTDIVRCLALGSLVSVLAAGAGGPSVAATAAGRSALPAGQRYVVTRDCEEEQAFVRGDRGAVARVLPRRFVAVEAPGSHDPVLFVRALSCVDVAFAGQSEPATVVSYGITVRSPDGTGCASAAPGVGGSAGAAVPVCIWFTLGWLTNDRRLDDWYHAVAPRLPVSYTAGLLFRLGGFDPASGGAPFLMTVPSSTDAPFTMRAVTRQRPGVIPTRGGYWNGVGRRSVKVVFASDSLTSGDATGTVSAPARTTLARLFGATSRPYLPVYAGIAAEHWDSAVYRVQFPAPTHDETRFVGTCSLTGSVRFTPPATNTAQHLRYDYPAVGTCSGRLDGRAISDAAVGWHQWGSAYGTCGGAYTWAPGRGRAVFAHHRALDFTLDFISHGTEVDFGFYGNRSGTSTGSGSFLTRRTSPTVLLDCAGSGARRVPLDVTLKTETPMASIDAVG
jgi:hypothetical protein